MNSFALHLAVFLLIGSHSISANDSSTTQKPPSLPSPPVIPSLSTLPTSLAHDRNDDDKTSSSRNSNINNGISNYNKDAIEAVHRQTTKTPRMIQRMVAGHLHLQSIPTSTTLRSTTASERSTSWTRIGYSKRPYQMSSSYRRKNVTYLTTSTTPPPTTTDPPYIEIEDLNKIPLDDNGDVALLETSDISTLDNDLLRLSASGGKEDKIKKKKKDSAKTLAEQVKEGKYGLIEEEIFSKPPKRPGVLSYHRNKEVPDDTEHNFGGLNEEDIWLAEDHLLVIKGGDLNENNNNEPWPALDDYVAPERQIKIPPNPKVPPPFPVQLEENGPLQFIGDNKFTYLYPFERNATTGQINPTAQGNGNDQKNFITGPGIIQTISNPKADSYYYTPATAPWLSENQTKIPFTLGPLPLHVNGSLDDIRDPDDEDPSKFYPPPYDFVYRTNYSNPVPPGPIVPGIVVPPPPHAFARLRPKVKTTTPAAFVEVVTYTPKTIIITPIPTTTLAPTTTTAKTTTATIQIQKQVLYAVPQTTTTTKPDDTSGTLRTNPIYYDYVDIKKPARPSGGRKPIQSFKHTVHHPTQSPKKFVYEDYLYITPKPEVRPNGVPTAAAYLPFKNKQHQSFEHEINVIRQALNFYKNQQLRDNNIPRTPKTKQATIFEYDEEPFKPMVTYSPPMNDANGFQAITVNPPTQRVGAKYLQAITDDSPHQWVLEKSQNMRAAPYGYQYEQPPPRQNNRFYEEPFSRPNPVRTIISNYRQPVSPQQPPLPWSLENDTYINYLPNYRPPINVQSEFISRNPYNDRIINQQQRVQNVPQQQYLPNRLAQTYQQPISLHKDTLVNYRHPLPPINPDSEFIPLNLHGSYSNRNTQYQQPVYAPRPNGGVIYRHQPQTQSHTQGNDPQSNIYYIQNTNKFKRN